MARSYVSHCTTHLSRTAGAMLGIAIVLGFLSPAVARAEIELELNRIATYSPEFPAKKKMNAAYRRELDGILRQIHERMAEGENVLCSAQIFEEAHWLVNYTDRKDDIDRRIADLRQSLGKTDQSFASLQDPSDGSFAPCMESWIWRFFRSVDPLKELAHKGEKPKVPLKIWDPVNTPEKLTAMMRKLVTSDVAEGHDKRKELNLAITSLGQLLWLDYTASVFPADLDRPALARALRDFVEKEWQDPQTGYWGAWFTDGGKTRRTHDLSITFHIISYLDGKVAHLSEIADTTAAVRNVPYPYGWDTGGTQNNHHAYDIARIINLTWDRMSEANQNHARATMFLLAVRSLALSINGSGAFDIGPYTTAGEAYYFGVSFFEETGLFGNPVAHKPGIGVAGTESLLDKISANLDKLDQTDPWVAPTRRKIADIRQKVK